MFNRVRRSSRQNRTPVTTMASFVHREGIAVPAYLGHLVTSTLAQHPLTPDGVPQSESNPVYQRPLAEAKHAAGDYPATGSARPGWNITPIKPRTAKFPCLQWTQSTKISMEPSIFPWMTWASKNRRLSAACSIRRRQRPHLPRRSASHPKPRVSSLFWDPRIPRLNAGITPLPRSKCLKDITFLNGLGTVTVLQFVIAFFCIRTFGVTMPYSFLSMVIAVCSQFACRYPGGYAWVPTQADFPRLTSAREM